MSSSNILGPQIGLDGLKLHREDRFFFLAVHDIVWVTGKSARVICPPPAIPRLARSLSPSFGLPANKINVNLPCYCYDYPLLSLQT